MLICLLAINSVSCAYHTIGGDSKKYTISYKSINSFTRKWFTPVCALFGGAYAAKNYSGATQVLSGAAMFYGGQKLVNNACQIWQESVVDPVIDDAIALSDELEATRVELQDVEVMAGAVLWAHLAGPGSNKAEKLHSYMIQDFAIELRCSDQRDACAQRTMINAMKAAQQNPQRQRDFRTQLPRLRPYLVHKDNLFNF